MPLEDGRGGEGGEGGVGVKLVVGEGGVGGSVVGAVVVVKMSSLTKGHRDMLCVRACRGGEEVSGDKERKGGKGGKK